jgi:exopolyphosphatase/guanosine-5'-triphosphate,3'-diphosphate pyrophosphatase
VGTELRSSDLAAVREQLGREPSIRFTVTARCTSGHPLVIRNAPLDADGHPFPTVFWLTCPDAVRAVARLESEGWIARLNTRAEEQAEFDVALRRAHEEYARVRAEDLPDAIDWGGVGGTRVGVKCLHAHYANHVAGGDDPVGRWVASGVEPIHPGQRSGRVAAIDQGTNSIRLLVLEPGPPASPAPTELARDMVITRLGRGVDRTGRLDEDALDRTLAVLEGFCRRARALSAKRIRVGATSAVRDAENRDDYVARARELTGSEPEVLSGHREAELTFLGAITGLDPDAAPPPYLVLDIGGGSTEFVVGSGDRVDDSTSTRIGSVRLTERHVASDPPTARELDAIGADVDMVLDDVGPRITAAAPRTLVAVAGTATTMQALAMRLDRYDPDRLHRTWLSLEAAEAVLEHLAAMTTPGRAALPVMAPGRGDVIVAGATILVRVMRRFDVDRALVSETDILDGLGLEMLDIR